MNKQLKMGIRVESEHKRTINFIRKMLTKDKKVTNKQIYAKIAKDHLKETPTYYTKLKKAKL